MVRQQCAAVGDRLGCCASAVSNVNIALCVHRATVVQRTADTQGGRTGAGLQRARIGKPVVGIDRHALAYQGSGGSVVDRLAS